MAVHVIIGLAYIDSTHISAKRVVCAQIKQLYNFNQFSKQINFEGKVLRFGWRLWGGFGHDLRTELTDYSDVGKIAKVGYKCTKKKTQHIFAVVVARRDWACAHAYTCLRHATGLAVFVETEIG